MLQPGETAPAFELPATGGKTVSLAERRGRKVVLFFYPKDDTSGCTLEGKDFSALLADFTKADTDVIGISPDGPKSHEKFCAKAL